MFSLLYVASLVLGPPSVLYLFYSVNIEFVNKPTIVTNLPPHPNYAGQNYRDQNYNGQKHTDQSYTDQKYTDQKYSDQNETKYILTWCEAYGGYQYGWWFGQDKFR